MCKMEEAFRARFDLFKENTGEINTPIFIQMDMVISMVLSALLTIFGKAGSKEIDWKIVEFDSSERIATLKCSKKSIKKLQGALAIYSYHQGSLCRITQVVEKE